METTEYEFCNAGPRGATFSDLLKSECVWLQYWVELPKASDVQKYHTLLINYSHEQQRLGRFAWDPNVRLRNVRDWLVAEKIVPDDAELSLVVAASFFVCCLVGAVALMLAKSSARASEFAVRRTLGASSIAIFSQALLETGVIGIFGGLLGLGLTLLSLRILRDLSPGGMGRIAHMDGTLLNATVLFAVVATLCAGIYPAWRAMRVSLAAQLNGGVNHCMEIVQILRALNRSKMGALIIVIQIALTLATVSNITNIVAARRALFTRPTGADEQNVFALGFRFTNDEGTKGMLETDLRSVRSVPNVVDVVCTNTLSIAGQWAHDGCGADRRGRTVHKRLVA